MATPLEREEYVEQAYFFRVFRERLADNLPAQEILSSVHDEVLTTTRLPLALQFLATDLKHSGLMGPAFGRMGHYFTPYQAFVMSQAEAADVRLTMPVAYYYSSARHNTAPTGRPCRGCSSTSSRRFVAIDWAILKACGRWRTTRCIRRIGRNSSRT